MRDLATASADLGGRCGRATRSGRRARRLHRSAGAARRLAQQLDDTPEALPDLAVSLDQVGQIQEELGELDAALVAYADRWI